MGPRGSLSLLHVCCTLLHTLAVFRAPQHPLFGSTMRYRLSKPDVIRYSSPLMGRGSRAVKRWRNDRQRKKKAREKKKAQEARAK